jgi:glyoxylate reductase
MEFKVFCTRTMREEGIDLLNKAIKHVEIWSENRPCPREVILEKAASYDALVCQMENVIDDEVLNHPNLKVVAQVAVGVDNIDLKAAVARKVPVCHTPGVLTEACADHTWALMLAVARRIVESNRYVMEGKWLQQDSMAFHGTDVYGHTLGIIGPGRIGQAVAKRGIGFSMNILYHGPHEKPELNHSGARFVPLDDLLTQSDFIVLNCPLTPATKGILGIDQFKRMKKTAIVVNMARGPCIVTEDLITALRDGLIAGCGLDVVEGEQIHGDHPLLKFQNCIMVSHIGSATVQARGQMALVAAQGVIDVLGGKRPQFCANPEVYSPST